MFKLLLALLVLTQFAFARPLTLEQKISDLDELIGQVRAGYGPLVYKNSFRGINVNSLRERYVEEIKNTKTNADFYYLLVRFVAEFEDSHFRASVPTDLVSTLGFSTDLVQGKVLIDEVDRNVLPESKFPFSKGDEIVSLGGKSAEEVLEELMPYMGQGFELSAKRRAAFMFAKRSGSKVPAPIGNVVVEVRRGDSAIIERAELAWKRTGFYTDELPNLKSRHMNTGIDYDSLQIEESFRCSGNSRIKVPANATMVTRDLFISYYYPTPKGNVGYLRLPHYSFPDKAMAFKQYEFAVKQLEKNTVGLVIDQDHNCGGSVEFLHQVMSLFMDRPFAPMQFELLASKAAYLSFGKWVLSANQFTLETENATKVANLIKDTWLNTDNFLTTKTSISGEEFRYPHHIRYTKPIVILIDELSGSGGDAFPALMGGYGRAKLLGTRTMGAGGHVEAITPLANSQVRVDMTKSLFYRPDGVPVENNGAVPDVEYKTTINDFKYGHQEYQKFFTDELLKMIP